ncbi:hypothetical protein P0O24_08535 [Methanotrichaceae archaeon M04Ac]|jgi:hypothetical protein|uniref:Uncharacterized protein n=1 Tax=Candidatus Methanocrinis alkalitolerans TaxID=3033395 RepID=A0ABT5XFX5_9EURY|nr:hypothetical protein [Candidatus Methanocrinis alkalitolerans]MCR3883158.1 hypothetical protein [Methanothrix sp.]MDF0593628.1 hypothetical protein [Candidatus Methanocrinis alkalitolerans]
MAEEKKTKEEEVEVEPIRPGEERGGGSKKKGKGGRLLDTCV